MMNPSYLKSTRRRASLSIALSILNAALLFTLIGAIIISLAKGSTHPSHIILLAVSGISLFLVKKSLNRSTEIHVLMTRELAKHAPAKPPVRRYTTSIP